MLQSGIQKFTTISIIFFYEFTEDAWNFKKEIKISTERQSLNSRFKYMVKVNKNKNKDNERQFLEKKIL